MIWSYWIPSSFPSTLSDSLRERPSEEELPAMSGLEDELKLG